MCTISYYPTIFEGKSLDLIVVQTSVILENFIVYLKVEMFYYNGEIYGGRHTYVAVKEKSKFDIDYIYSNRNSIDRLISYIKLFGFFKYTYNSTYYFGSNIMETVIYLRATSFDGTGIRYSIAGILTAFVVYREVYLVLLIANKFSRKYIYKYIYNYKYYIILRFIVRCLLILILIIICFLETYNRYNSTDYFEYYIEGTEMDLRAILFSILFTLDYTLIIFALIGVSLVYVIRIDLYYLSRFIYKYIYKYIHKYKYYLISIFRRLLILILIIWTILILIIWILETFF